MQKGYHAIITKGWALLLMVALQACSLSQRDQTNLARVQLNTRSAQGGSSRLSSILSDSNGVALPPPTAKSYYLIDVEGEGIRRDMLLGDKCFSANHDGASVLVSALNGPQDDSVEFLVPVGKNRTVRIYRIDFDGSVLPFAGEDPFNYWGRAQPKPMVTAGPYIMAEATIPNLSGDQSISLIEKSAAISMANQCGINPSQDTISNGEVEISNYHPDAGAGVIRIWDDPTPNSSFVARFTGQLRNISTTGLYAFTGIFSGTMGAPSTGQLNNLSWFATGAPLAPNLDEFHFFSQGATYYYGGAHPGGDTISHTLNYYLNPGALSNQISRSVSIQKLGLPHVTVDSTPIRYSSGGVVYSNLYSVKVTAVANVAIEPMDPDSVFPLHAFISPSPSGSPAEVSAVVPPATAPSPCPMNTNGASRLTLPNGGYCYIYFAVYEANSLVSGSDQVAVELHLGDPADTGRLPLIQRKLTLPGGYRAVSGNSHQVYGPLYYDSGTPTGTLTLRQSVVNTAPFGMANLPFSASTAPSPNPVIVSVSRDGSDGSHDFVLRPSTAIADWSDYAYGHAYSIDKLLVERSLGHGLVTHVEMVLEGVDPLSPGQRVYQRELFDAHPIKFSDVKIRLRTRSDLNGPWSNYYPGPFSLTSQNTDAKIDLEYQGKPLLNGFDSGTIISVTSNMNTLQTLICSVPYNYFQTFTFPSAIATNIQAQILIDTLESAGVGVKAFPATQAIWTEKIGSQ